MIEKIFVVIVAITILMVGIDRSISQMDSTPSLSNPSIAKPILPQCGKPMSSRMIPREPTLVIPLFPKKENEVEEKEECPLCREIPIIGADGEIANTIKVHLYNAHKTTFNRQDALLYFADVYKFLRIYRVDGVWYSAALAQAYTEGGAGKTGVYVNTNNLFGMRAGANWDGYVYSRSTQTVYKSYEVAKKFGAKDLFRAYGSHQQSIRDYLKLVQRDSYKSALSTKSPRAYLKELLKNGYGTSSMLNTWVTVINMFDLTSYDKNKTK